MEVLANSSSWGISSLEVLSIQSSAPSQVVDTIIER